MYVDWIIDPHLNRDNVTKDTAKIIRDRMKASKALMLAISTNVNLSKWIPWEFGFADGRASWCAIFPVAESITPPKAFERSEYLLLYPYIKQATLGITQELFLIESAHSYVLVDNWIQRNASPEYKSLNIENL